MSGTLYVVATPIGHLEDLTPRARRLLSQVDLVACEDTRRTGRLLAGVAARPRLVSLHEHNERNRTPGLVEAIAEGTDVVLVSDAGTPLVSDPGYVLVRAVIERGLPVVPVPGPSAVLAALTASGLPPHPFTFLGFTPRKSGKRRAFYREAGALGHTFIAFESPHRIVPSLDDAAAALGERPAVVARELTKLHEEVLRGSLSTLRDLLAERPSVKGEIVLVVGPPDDARSD